MHDIASQVRRITGARAPKDGNGPVPDKGAGDAINNITTTNKSKTNNNKETNNETTNDNNKTQATYPTEARIRQKKAEQERKDAGKEPK